MQVTNMISCILPVKNLLLFFCLIRVHRVLQLLNYLSVSDLDVFSLSERGKKSGGGASRSSETEEPTEDSEDNSPLFYSPGKRGFYSPRQGKASFERLNAFRNVGRYLIYHNTFKISFNSGRYMWCDQKIPIQAAA